MIRPEMIPDEVVEAAGKAIWYDGSGFYVTPEYIKNAIAAALAAWPDGTISKFEWGKAFIILPLPTENSNE